MSEEYCGYDQCKVSDCSHTSLHEDAEERVAEIRRLREDLLFIRDKWDLYGARGCPACVYENGKFIRLCKIHEWAEKALAAHQAVVRELAGALEERHKNWCFEAGMGKVIPCEEPAIHGLLAHPLVVQSRAEK